MYRTRVTPNQLTWISAVMGVISGALFAQGEPAAFVAAGIAAQLSSIIDGADGMLARARGQCSEFGSHLDLFLDRIIDFCVFAGIALGASRHFQAPHLLALGLLATGLYQLQIILFYLTKSYLKSEERGDTGEARAVLYWAGADLRRDRPAGHLHLPAARRDGRAQHLPPRLLRQPRRR